MNVIDLLTDPYDRKARLYPALIVVLPVAGTAVVLLAMKVGVTETVLFLLVSCGGAFMLSQLARDAGYRKQPGLWKSWGGPPTDRMLSHSDTRLNTLVKKRYHAKLAQLVAETKVPTAADEQNDPEGTKAVYAAWSHYLRTQTRDQKRFSLLFKENINYGHRRNLWGMRPVGIISTLLCCAVIGGWSWWQCRLACAIDKPLLICFVVDFIFLLLWLFVFTPRWVHIPAIAYSERLLEAVDQLS